MILDETGLPETTWKAIEGLLEINENPIKGVFISNNHTGNFFGRYYPIGNFAVINTKEITTKIKNKILDNKSKVYLNHVAAAINAQILKAVGHELAHAKGIEDENKCNEMAFEGIYTLIKKDISIEPDLNSDFFKNEIEEVKESLKAKARMTKPQKHQIRQIEENVMSFTGENL